MESEEDGTGIYLEKFFLYSRRVELRLEGDGAQEGACGHYAGGLSGQTNVQAWQGVLFAGFKC
jgi:hypothetical protein